MQSHLSQTTLLALALAAPALAQPRITGIEPIPLAPGMNRVEKFAPDGGDGTIIMAWRDNSNAWGYNLYLVMTGKNGVGMSVVGIQRSAADGDMDRFQDVIRDSPHTGEDTIRAVRFARAQVDGQQAILLLTATRRIEVAVPDPAPAVVEAFRLMPGAEVGVTWDYFAPILRVQPPGLFCSAEPALLQVFRVPLPRGYKGARSEAGC